MLTLSDKLMRGAHREVPRCQGVPVLRREKNVTLYSSALGYKFNGYRVCVAFRGVVRCRYFSARRLGWQRAYDEAVLQAREWRTERESGALTSAD